MIFTLTIVILLLAKASAVQLMVVHILGRWKAVPWKNESQGFQLHKYTYKYSEKVNWRVRVAQMLKTYLHMVLLPAGCLSLPCPPASLKRAVVRTSRGKFKPNPPPDLTLAKGTLPTEYKCLPFPPLTVCTQTANGLPSSFCQLLVKTVLCAAKGHFTEQDRCPWFLVNIASSLLLTPSVHNFLIYCHSLAHTRF